MFNVLSENGEVEEVEGDGGGRTGPPLALLPKPHLLSQETEMWFVGQQTQHYLEEEGSEGGRRERGRTKGEREEEGREGGRRERGRKKGEREEEGREGERRERGKKKGERGRKRCRKNSQPGV